MGMPPKSAMDEFNKKIGVLDNPTVTQCLPNIPIWRVDYTWKNSKVRDRVHLVWKNNKWFTISEYKTAFKWLLKPST